MGKSWSELSQSEKQPKSATILPDASGTVQEGILEVAKEGSGGRSWGEVRSDAEGRVMLNSLGSQPVKGDESKLEKFTREENEYGSGKDNVSITKEEKEEKEEKEDKAVKEAKKKKKKKKKKRGKKGKKKKKKKKKTMEGLAET